MGDVTARTPLLARFSCFPVLGTAPPDVEAEELAVRGLGGDASAVRDLLALKGDQIRWAAYRVTWNARAAEDVHSIVVELLPDVLCQGAGSGVPLDHWLHSLTVKTAADHLSLEADPAVLWNLDPCLQERPPRHASALSYPEILDVIEHVQKASSIRKRGRLALRDLLHRELFDMTVFEINNEDSPGYETARCRINGVQRRLARMKRYIWNLTARRRATGARKLPEVREPRPWEWGSRRQTSYDVGIEALEVSRP